MSMLKRVRQSAFSLLLVLVLGFVMGLGVAAPRVAQSATGGDGEPDLLKAIYAKVNPSVVTITVRIPASALTSQGLMPVPQGQGGLGQNGRQAYAYAAGSGFVYDTNGRIVTNEHVVEGADRIEVTFSDDTMMHAKVVGVDADSDVAVIQVDGNTSKYQPLTIANSDEVQVGDRAIAIGNPFERAGTMTQGIISGVHRSVDAVAAASNGTAYQIPDALQTDAAINPGNSGGPLLNSDGAVIGINEQIASDSNVRQSSGVSFAIPSNLVKSVADGLITDGKVTHSWLGIAGNSLDLDTDDALKLPNNTLGVYVNAVQPNSPADKAGIKGGSDTSSVNGQDITVGGDVITAVDGQTIHHFDDLTSYLFTKTKVGQTITLTVLRDGKSQDIKVTLAARPTSTN